MARAASLAFALIAFLAASVQAQPSITHREGIHLDQYAIDAPGEDYDNNRVIIAHHIAEVLVQVSGVNHHTSSENLLCWDDPDILECPNDEISPGVFRMPALTALNDIMVASGVTMGADLTELQEKSLYLGFWHEYRTKKLITDTLAEMVLEGLNPLQQKRGLKFVYFAQGIDLVTAAALAADRVDSGIIATYDDYGLATVPLHDRRLIKIFGEVGWFEAPE